jgi:hypothetical protein
MHAARSGGLAGRVRGAEGADLTGAERRMGEALADAPKATGGQPLQATGTARVPVAATPPTLAAIGVTLEPAAPQCRARRRP